jgi:hypothetical protein
MRISDVLRTGQATGTKLNGGDAVIKHAPDSTIGRHSLQPVFRLKNIAATWPDGRGNMACRNEPGAKV